MWLLPIAALAAMLAFLPYGEATIDMQNFLLPWMEAVRARGVQSLSGEFSNYTPPYVYLMYLFSPLAPLIGPVATIKLIPVPFIVLAATGVFRLVSRLGVDRRGAVAAAMVVLLCPSVFVNTFVLGQADVIYTAFLVWFIVFANERRPLLAALMFGLSFSFKAQAVFLSPFLLYLVLSGQMRVWQLLVPPITYLAMMTPAALFGRPWSELLTVYVAQSEFFRFLAVAAPNPWRIVQFLEIVSYETGVKIGMAVGALTGLVLSFGSLRAPRGSGTNLLVAVLCAALMPYVLPKMHDRYFFVADVLAIALAFAVPRLWPAPVLLQVGSFVALLAFFKIEKHGASFAFFPVSAAILLIAAAWLNACLADEDGLRRSVSELKARFRPARR